MQNLAFYSFLALQGLCMINQQAYYLEDTREITHHKDDVNGFNDKVQNISVLVLSCCRFWL